MDAESYPRAEEALRLLAAAVGAARLYPPASALPQEAAAKFTSRANALTATEPLRYTIDPHGVRVGADEVSPGQSQVVGLAESLHAMQAGQLVIAPGLTLDETRAFVSLANSDATTVRAVGGPRAVLGRAKVRHIAIIEVSLRQSEESGLLGVDLAVAPLDEIAEQVTLAARRRAEEAVAGPARDEMAEAIERLEEATRELAMERVAAALLRLDEATRMQVLALSLSADSRGERMEGMLSVVARMKPASLARLLSLVAKQANTDPRRISAALQLPPETARALQLLLSPSPDIAPDFGVPDAVQASRLAREMAIVEDSSDLERQVAIAAPGLASGRALATATSVSRTHVDADTVHAIGEMLPGAARDGAFTTVREALRRLDEIASDPSLADAVLGARNTLSDPAVLRDVCQAPETDADAAIAGEILQAAGTAGADALLDCYVRIGQPKRSLLRPVLRGSSEMVLSVARPKLRSAEPAVAVGIVRALAALGDRRAVALIGETLENHLDEQVRFAAATALASMRVPEAIHGLVHVLGRGEVETQRHVVKELGRIRAVSAVPALARAFDDVKVLTRSYEMRKDIISALAMIGTPEAEKVLHRFATRPGLGRKSRELKRLSAQAITMMSHAQGVEKR